MDQSPPFSADLLQDTDAAAVPRSGPGQEAPLLIRTGRGHLRLRGLLQLDEATLRALVARHPLYVIAGMYRCTIRSIKLRAAQFGLHSAFVPMQETEAEAAYIREGVAAGQSIKNVADTLGRSQDFVARRFRKLQGLKGEVPLGRREDKRWPVPNTTMADALGGRRYDDMGSHILDRECPPGRRPINGAALACAARLGATSYSRSTADLCAES